MNVPFDTLELDGETLIRIDSKNVKLVLKVIVNQFHR